MEFRIFKLVCTVKALYIAVFHMSVSSFELILWILSCYTVTMHCQNIYVIFNFAETVQSRNSQNKSPTKCKAFTVFHSNTMHYCNTYKCRHTVPYQPAYWHLCWTTSVRLFEISRTWMPVLRYHLSYEATIFLFLEQCLNTGLTFCCFNACSTAPRLWYHPTLNWFFFLRQQKFKFIMNFIVVITNADNILINISTSCRRNMYSSGQHLDLFWQPQSFHQHFSFMMGSELRGDITTNWHITVHSIDIFSWTF